MIEPTSTRSTDTWWLIDQLIDSFIANNPAQWRAFEVEMAQIRHSRHNPKYADSADKNSAHRWSASFPNGANGINLLDAMLKVEPRLLKDKRKWATFMKRYPAFRVPEKY